jgi:Peptidase C13 family
MIMWRALICFLLLICAAPLHAQSDVEAKVAAMPAGVAGQSELFVISLAGDGKQTVFRREAETALKHFDARYGTAARSLLLSNQPQPDLRTPITSRLTVEAAIKAVAARMNREEDILLLFLTSHGWKDGTIALSNGSNDLPPLSAVDVNRWLRDSGIARSIIIVSACYSGTWAKSLADPNRIILMAARPDRTSFGCSDDRELTFFGQALFAESMAQGLALLPAFDQAKRVISAWEKDARLEPSEPQMSLGAKLLPLWRAQEAQLANGSAVAAIPPAPVMEKCRRTTATGKC